MKSFDRKAFHQGLDRNLHMAYAYSVTKKYRWGG